MSTEQNNPTDAQCAAAGLRQLADMLDANPDLPAVRYAFASINVFPRHRAGVAAWARAAMRSTGTMDKHQDALWAGINVRFGSVKVDVSVDREEICERIVTGTREVTVEVPDPEQLAAVPTVSVTKTVEDVEWICRPLLDDATTAPAVAA